MAEASPLAEHRPTPLADAADWLRRNLFSGVWNTLLTLLALYALVRTVPELYRWTIGGAVFGHQAPETCKGIEGACWAIIWDKYRLILFGRYPYDLQWRPLVGMAELLAVVVVSCNRRFWHLRLLALWAIALALYFWLLGGGFGLQPVPTGLWGGLPLTLLLAVIGIAAAFPLSILLALGRRSSLPVIRAMCVVYIELIRGVPLISLLFMASFMLPLFMPVGVSINDVLRAQVAIVMFTAAYLAEVVRGGLQAIPKGQVEAAEAMGLGYWQVQGLIVLPQALRLVIPPMVNTFIGLFKDTSLVSIVGLSDLYLAMRQAIADPNWRPYYTEAYIFVAVIYFVFCFGMSKYSQHLEASFRTTHTR